MYTLLRTCTGSSHTSDEGLGSLDLFGIAVVKNTEAPDAAAQLGISLVGGESHGEQFDAVCQLVAVQTLDGSVPTEGHLGGAVDEQCQFFAAVDGRIESDEAFSATFGAWSAP